jgi:hypothetical protein
LSEDKNNVIQFPGKPEEPVHPELSCPEEGCGNTFFVLRLNEETEEVIPTCARCDNELNPFPYEEE